MEREDGSGAVKGRLCKGVKSLSQSNDWGTLIAGEPHLHKSHEEHQSIEPLTGIE